MVYSSFHGGWGETTAFLKEQERQSFIGAEKKSSITDHWRSKLTSKVKGYFRKNLADLTRRDDLAEYFCLHVNFCNQTK